MTLATWLIWSIFVLAILAFVVRSAIDRASTGGAMWGFTAVAGALLTWFLMAGMLDILDEAPAVAAWKIPIYLLVGLIGLVAAIAGCLALRRPSMPHQEEVEEERAEEPSRAKRGAALYPTPLRTKPAVAPSSRGRRGLG